MGKKYYLAYGSNLNVEQMRYRCPDARVLGTAWIYDYRLLFKGSKTGSYLTIEQEDGAKVPVAVWEVLEADEQRLDIYEGTPDFYYKTEMPITYTGIQTRKEKAVVAFVYIMHEHRPFGIPSSRYVDICSQGYTTFGFDTKFLVEAYEISKKEAEKHAKKK